MKNALQLLRRIGMRSSYKGYYYFASAIALTVSDSSYLQNVTKNLYVTVAHLYQTPIYCVEPALRTLIDNYWVQHNDSLLFPLLGYPLHDKPTAREFISILSDYLRDNSD